jgi:transglutaminase-like putative cysteine protease
MKKTLSVVLSIVIFACFLSVSPVMNARAASAADITDNKNGTFTLKYDNSDNAKVVVQVVRDGSETKYNYYLSDGKVTEVIPLTDGNGDYSVWVCKNVSGSKYSVVATGAITLKLDDSALVYKNSNIIVDYETKDKAIAKAVSLTKGCKTQTAIITTIYNYMVKNYAYDYGKVSTVQSTVGYIPSIATTYSKKMGICYDIASLYAAMLRSKGVAAKVATGYCKTIDSLHAWNEVYDEDAKKWYIIDITSDIAYYAAGVKYSMKKSSKVYYAVMYYH